MQATSTKTWTRVTRLLFFFFFASPGFPAAVLRHSTVMDSKTEMEKEIVPRGIAIVLESLCMTQSSGASGCEIPLHERQLPLALQLGQGGKESFPSQVEPARAFGPALSPPFPPPHTTISRGRARVGVSLSVELQQNANKRERQESRQSSLFVRDVERVDHENEV